MYSNENSRFEKPEGVFCSHCHSKKYRKNGTEKGIEKDFQRY